MRKLKPSVRAAIASTLVLTSTAVGAYAIDNILEKKSEDIGNKLKLDVEKIDSDTVKVAIDNVQDIPKSLQFSIKLDGNVSLKDGQSSIHDLVKEEAQKRIKSKASLDDSNSILTDYTYNENENTIDVLITSSSSLPKTGNKIDIFELDVKENGSAPYKYKVLPNNENEYKYVSSNNKEYNSLGVAYDDKTISMNTPPTIEASKNYIEIKDGETLTLTPEKLGITIDDLDGKQTVRFEVRDASKSNKPIITEFKTDTPGIYDLECVAIDNYNEKSETATIQIKVVLDSVEELPVITRDNEPLKDITISGGDIFRPLENVKAVDARGRAVEVKVNVDKELNLDPEVDTVYTLTYTATDIYGNKAEESIKLNVLANKAPVIKGVKDHTIKVGDSFDPKVGVTVEDEDNNIELIVDSNVNTSIPGDYKVSYSATDSKGKTTRVQSSVRVNPKQSAINSIPVITASDKSIKVGDNFTNEDALKGVTAYDEEDKDITDKIEVIQNNVKTDKEGTYTVVYSVEDSKGAKVTKTINVVVTKNIILAESISINNKFDKLYLGSSKELTATVNKEATVKDVKWTSSDEKIASIEVVGNTAKITAKSEGKVTITATTTDGSNKSDSLTIDISSFENDKTIPSNIADVIDTNIVLPVTGDGSVDRPVELHVKEVETDKFNEFIKNLKSLNPIIESIREEGNFTVYKIKLSEKARLFKRSTETYVEIRVDNNLKNADEMKKVLNSISNQAPQIIIEGLDTTINVGDKFNELDGVKAIDFEGNDITSDIKVIGKVDTSKPGDYELTYEVTDKNGVKSSMTVIITVVKKETPVDPENPVNPETPVDPGTPVVPGNPGTSQKPVVKPSNSNNTNNTNKTETADKSEKPQASANTQQSEEETLKGNIPTIKLTSAIDNIFVGDVFDELDGISATDIEDGDLTDKIEVIGNVNTLKAGKYTLTYEVVDSDSNIATLKRVITVEEKENIEESKSAVDSAKDSKTGIGAILGAIGLGSLAVGGLVLNRRKK